MNKSWLAMAPALAALFAPLGAHAYSTGTSNRSASGCIGIIPSCHNDTMPQRNGAMVTIDGPTTVAAGERVTYTLRVARTDMGTLAGAGLDVSVSGGGLRPNGSNTRIENCELTHSGIIVPATAGAGEVTIPFDFIAPAASTTVTIQAAGNGVDGNGRMAGQPGQTGDQWGTSTLSVTITGTADAGGACLQPTPDAGPDAAPDASSDGAIEADASDAAAADGSLGDAAQDGSPASDAANDGGTNPPPPPGCQCAVPAAQGGSRSTALAWLSTAALLALSFARRARRSPRSTR